MDSEIMVEPLPLLGVCNLCLEMNAVKSMLIGHNHNGNVEIYTDMLKQTFLIDVSMLELGDIKRMICDVCVSKLRDTLKFRQQVETSLKNLEITYKNSVKANDQQEKCILDDFDIATSEIDENEIVKKEEKLENVDVLDDFDIASSEVDEDDIALKDILVKKEYSEAAPKSKRKPISHKKKILKYYSKKNDDITDTEIMLKQGLFPFKMRKNRLFACAICSEKFTNLDEIKTHTSDHTKRNVHVAFEKMMYSKSQRFFKLETKLRCKICTKDISNYDELKNHIDNCTQLKYASCKWSNLPFKLEKDQLDCPVCEKTFLNFVSLNTHMNVHYPNFVCDNCGKAFASSTRLRGHMRTHEIGEFPCKFCDAVFDRVTKRENHVSKEHKAGVRYACKRCNISLTSFYARQKHLAEVHNEELKKYKCKACPQSYITPGHLSSHVRRDHLNERNHKCDHCDLAFYTKNALKMHMIKHEGERIHSCHICQKSYQRKKTLREHMRIHTNDKRFVCPVCGRAFTQKCTLKGHLKVHARKIDVDDRVAQPLHSI